MYTSNIYIYMYTLDIYIYIDINIYIHHSARGSLFSLNINFVLKQCATVNRNASWGRFCFHKHGFDVAAVCPGTAMPRKDVFCFRTLLLI